MSGLTGTQLDKDYVEVGGVKLPVPRHPYGEQDEWLAMRTTPLEPFQASVVLGDDSLVSDDRVATGVLSDVRPGTSVRRYTEVESLAGIADGDLMTLEGVTHLPLFRSTLVTNGGGGAIPALQTPMWGYGFKWSQRYRFAVWGRTASGAVSRMYIWDSTTNAFVLPVGFPNAAPPVSGFVRLGQYWVTTDQTSIWYTTDGLNYTQGWSPGAPYGIYGLVRHDNKIYALVWNIGTNELIMRWISTIAQLTAGVGVAWPGVSSATYVATASEAVGSLVEWTDKVTGDAMIYVVTSQQIIGYNDGDFWVHYWDVPNANDAYRPYGFFNPRDRLLYVCFEQNDSIFVFNHQQEDEVGPNKNFSLLTNGDTLHVCQLAGNSRHMFLFGYNQQGRVMVANDAFGWSPLARARLTTPDDLTSAPLNANEKIIGMFYFQSRLVLLMQGGGAEYIEFPDQAVSAYNFSPTAGLPFSRAYDGFYLGAARAYWQFYAEFDAGNELLWKLLKYLRVHLERITGAYALPANHEVYLKYRVDGGAWSATTTLTSASTFPNVLPLPALANQVGVPFRKLQVAVGMRGENASFNYDIGILRAIEIAFTREPDIFDGLQVTVDLSDDRWTDGNGKVIGHFYGRDRRFLRAFVETLKSGPGQAKQHYKVVLGGAYEQKTYQSMDVRVSAVEDPQDRYGRYTLTLRDLTAPASG